MGNQVSNYSGAANGPPVAESTADSCNFGQRLQTLRGEQNLSRAELGERSGVSPGTIRRIEQGASPGLDTVLRLASGLGLPLITLIEPVDHSGEPLRELIVLMRGCTPRVIAFVTRIARAVILDTGVLDNIGED